jgi:tetratricopeptide (TPR) repeat protein
VARTSRASGQKARSGPQEAISRFVILSSVFQRACLSIAAAALVVAAATAQPPQKKVKDQAEYDLYTSATKETDATKRLATLNTWLEKYPGSDFKEERLVIFLISYTQLAQAPKVVETAREILAIDPKEVNALKWLTIYTQSYPQPPTPDSLATGEKAAQGLLGVEKPPNVDDAQWKTTQTQLAAIAHNTLGFIAMQRKQPAQAEQEYKKALDLNPNWCEVSYALGNAVLAEKDLARQSEVLYHWARSASLTGTGACPDPQRKQIDTFFQKQYNLFHGQDEGGLKQLRALAVSQPLPPAGFVIKNTNEIQAEEQAKAAAANPQLALWKSIKDNLVAEDGQKYFESTVKGAALPGGANGVTRFKGKLVSMKPAVDPKELVLAISAPDTPEITLELETPLRGKAAPGTEIGFEGVASAFSKAPFMLTFDVDSKDKIEGWPAQSTPPAKKRAPVRKKP